MTSNMQRTMILILRQLNDNIIYISGNLKIRVTIEEEGFLLIADTFLNGK